jgi:hypothetical protein
MPEALFFAELETLLSADVPMGPEGGRLEARNLPG